MKTSFVAVCTKTNSWGRGASLADAKKQLRKAGGRCKGAQFRRITGDDKPYIDDMGGLIVERGATVTKISATGIPEKAVEVLVDEKQRTK